MIAFPNCKINFGLWINSKRTDGFHNLETVFYPVPLCDGLEIIFNSQTIKKTQIISYGNNLSIKPNENICIKAYHLLSQKYSLPPIDIHLYKKIPSGAGLGGGSSDAAFTLKLLNNLFSLNINDTELQKLASSLGADCAFFIYNKAVYAKGIGNEFENINIDLSAYYITLIKPELNINTTEAFKDIKPLNRKNSLKNIVQLPITEWQENLTNDFEFGIFKKYPELKKIKNKLISLGALYAAMSGSGSTIYGLFKEKIICKNDFEGCKIYQYKLN